MAVQRTHRTPFIQIIFILSLLIMVLFASGCSNRVWVTGRISFGESWGCGSALPSQDINWQLCHQLKQHFDRLTEAPVTANEEIPETLRPLSAAIRIQRWKILPGNRDHSRCGDSFTVQTTREGYYLASAERCGARLPTYITAEVFLQHEIYSSTRRQMGTIRAVWPQALAASLFGFSSPEAEFHPGTTPEVGEAPGFTNTQGDEYTIPRLAFRSSIMIEPEDRPEDRAGPEMNFGNTVFLERSDGDAFDYMKNVLSSYQTMIELHYRLRDIYSNRSSETALDAETRYFDRMFGNTGAPGWDHSYMVAFGMDRDARSGWFGVNFQRPDAALFQRDSNSDGAPDGVWPYSFLISDVGVISHEFGHTAQFAFVPEMMSVDYNFAGSAQRSPTASDRPRLYSVGHDYGQFQELGVAVTEGVASTIGQYLTNRCQGWVHSRFGMPALPARPSGGPDSIEENGWNGDQSCDSDEFCRSHHVRYILAHRFPDDTQILNESDRRQDAVNSDLRSLTATARQVGFSRVLSNNEARVAEFLCDLLDDRSPAGTDVSHALGEYSNRGVRYIPNFTFEVGKILAGVPFSANSVRPRNYPDTDPQPEEITLTLPAFFNGMRGVCLRSRSDGSFVNRCQEDQLTPSTESTPRTIAAMFQLAASDTYGYDRYNHTRLDIFESPLSMQSLGRSLVEQRLIRGNERMTPIQELNNLLRTNFMETVPER